MFSAILAKVTAFFAGVVAGLGEIFSSKNARRAFIVVSIALVVLFNLQGRFAGRAKARAWWKGRVEELELKLEAAKQGIDLDDNGWKPFWRGEDPALDVEEFSPAEPAVESASEPAKLDDPNDQPGRDCSTD